MSDFLTYISDKVYILWILLGVLFSLSVVFSVIYIYHWQSYGMNSQATFVAKFIYIFTMIALFVGAFISVMFV